MELIEQEWALVLAGGGGKGAYEIGVYKALEEFGLMERIKGMSGASVGALNLGLIECNPYARAKLAWENISPEYFLDLDPTIEGGKEALMSRDGLIHFMAEYTDLDLIRESNRDLYVSVTDYGNNAYGEGHAKYYRLNGKSYDEIRNLMLATSALPAIYEPVQIEGSWCRDGGLTDNLPITPLYIEGYRHFIVVCLKPEKEIPMEKFPDAEFILIKPEVSLGEFINGTMDFTAEGASVRSDLGYLDAKRILSFYGRDLTDAAVLAEYEQLKNIDYTKHRFHVKYKAAETIVTRGLSEMDKLLTKYGVKWDDSSKK